MPGPGARLARARLARARPALPRPSAILKNNSPKGQAYARIPLYDSPRDRGHSHRHSGGPPKRVGSPGARVGPPPWDLSLLGIRVSREIFALGHRLRLSAARDRLLRSPRRVPPAQRARSQDPRAVPSGAGGPRPLGRVRLRIGYAGGPGETHARAVPRRATQIDRKSG